jgi:hypothetical protein
MASYTTRVQLDGYPTSEDYEKLHREMKKRGFSRIIQSDQGQAYWLPHGEYNRVGDATRGTVRDDAKAAAASVSNDYQVLVAEAVARTWFGLKKATALEAMGK